jgi:hypothetical protein
MAATYEPVPRQLEVPRPPDCQGEEDMSGISRELLLRFAAASARYSGRTIRAADANANGTLTRKEARALGDIADTFALYARPGTAVKTADFARFYEDYVRVAAASGSLPADLGNNFANWLALQATPADDALVAAAAASAEDLVRFVINYRADVLDYYDYGDDDQILADAASLRAYFAAAEWTLTSIPEPHDAHRAFKALANDPDEILDGGEVVVLLDRAGNVTELLLRRGEETTFTAASDIGDPIDLDALTTPDAPHVDTAARALSDYLDRREVRAAMPPYWSDAYGRVEAAAPAGLKVIYDYEWFAGSDMSEAEHIAAMRTWLDVLVRREPALAACIDLPVEFLGPWGT